MKVAIKDANILIDLEIAGLLDLWLQLGYETHINNLVVGQLDEGNHTTVLEYIEAGVFSVDEISGESMSATLNLLREVGSGPDLVDCSVLIQALELDAILLTGDRALRRAAEKKNIEVRGTIWIFDQLIEQGLLMPKLAATKLQHLLNEKRYLPVKKCQSRVVSWIRSGQ